MGKFTRTRWLCTLILSVFLSVATTSVRATTCAGATNIPSLPVTSQSLVCGAGNDLNATNVSAACGAATNSYKGGNEALYTWTATATGFLDVSYTGQAWTSIFIYNGCPTSGGTCVNSVGSSATSKSISVAVTTGNTYYIWFDTWPTPNSPCAGTFSASFNNCAPTIATVTPSVSVTSANFNFSAVTLGVGDSIQIEYGVGSFTQGTGTLRSSSVTNFSITGLTTGTGYTYFVRRKCSGGVTAWSTRSSTFTPTCTTVSTVTPTNVSGTSSNFNFSAVILGVGDSLEIEYGVGSFTQGTGTFVRSGSNNFTVTGLTSNTGYTYFVRRRCAGGSLSSWSTRSSTFTTAPVNTACSGAVVLGAACAGSPVAGTTVNAAPFTGYTNCGAGTSTNPLGVWYKYVGDNNNVTINTCTAGGMTDTRLTVYTGTCGSLTCVTGNDDDNTCGVGTLRSKVSFDAYAGNDFYIFVHNYTATTTGTFTLNLTCAALCTPFVGNGTCATATTATVPATTCTPININNTCAATALSEPIGAPLFGTYPNVWYSFTAPSDQVTFKVTLGTATNVGIVVDSTCTGIHKGYVYPMVNNQNYAISGLTVGATYKVQLYTPAANKGTFDLCMTYDPCPTPLAGTAVAGTNSATLSWTSSGTTFDVEVRTAGSTFTGLPTDSVVPNGFVKTGLTSATDYTYYVRRNCGSGVYSSWNGPFNFSTLINCQTTAVMTCGSPVSTTVSGTGNWDPVACGFNTPGKETVRRFRAPISGSYYIVQSSSSGYVDYMFKDSVGATCDATGWTCIDDLTGAATSPTFSLIGGTTYYILADPEGTGSNSFTFTMACPLTCANPGTPSASNVSAYSADITWTAGGSETAWDLYYGITPLTAPTLATTPTLQNVTSRNPYNLTGLTASSSYQLYVRADCGANDTSNWVGPVSFTTLAPPPANDSCSQAIAVSCGGTYTGSTSSATQDTYSSDCGAGGAPTSQKGVWYKYVATGDSTVTASLCGSSYDSRITVYTGTCGALTCVAGNDDFCGLQSQATFNALTGNTYYIMVHAFGATSGGSYTLNISCAPYVAPPVNDNCATATNVTVNAFGSCTVTASANNSAATASLGVTPVCISFATLYDVWHKFTASGTSVNIKITNGTATNVGFQLFDACGGTQLNCTPVATSGNTYTISGLTNLAQYRLRTFTESGDQGTYTICLQAGPPPPSNDDCSGATLLGCGSSVAGSTQYATSGTEGSLGTCGTTITAPGVWYHVIGNGADFTVSTCGGAAWDTKINVFTGTCGSLTCVGGNDDFCGTQSSVTWTTTSGTNYYVLVQGFGGTTGTFTISASCSGLATWLGTNSVWSNPANWTSPFVPSTCADKVIIPVTANNPIITSDVTVGDVTLNSGAGISLNGGDLNVCGNWFGSGVVSGNNAVVFNNSTTLGLSQSLSGNTEFNNLRVNRPGTSSVRVKAGSLPAIRTSLVVTSGKLFSTASPILLLSDATKTAYVDDFSGSGSMLGKITVQRYATGPGATLTQHQISTGASGVKVKPSFGASLSLSGPNGAQLIPDNTCTGLQTGSPYTNLMEYDPTAVSTCQLEGYRTRNGGFTTAGRGYVANVPNATTLSYQGNYVTGNVPVSVVNTGNLIQDGWNLIGNPYASAVQFSTFAGIDPVGLIYVPTGEYAGSYSTLAAGDDIASSQGFWVKAINPSATYTFSNAQRVIGSPTWNRKSMDNAVNLEVASEGHKDVTTVRFDANATANYDLGLDGGKLLSENGQPTIYSLIRGNMASINTIRNAEETPSVAVAVKMAKSGTAVIRAKDVMVSSDVALILEDKTTGTFQDLRNNPEYTFEYDATAENNNRFVLHFRADAANNQVDIYSNNGTVFVDFTRLSKVDATIAIYNILGQEIANGKANSSTIWSKEVSGADAAYAIVRVKNGNDITTEKVFIGANR